MSIILSLLSNWRVLALAGVVVLVGLAYGKGRLDQAAINEAAAKDAQIEALTKSIKISTQALEDAVERAHARDAEKKSLEQKVKDYENQLESAADCVLSDADAERLQNIK